MFTSNTAQSSQVSFHLAGVRNESARKVPRLKLIEGPKQRHLGESVSLLIQYFPVNAFRASGQGGV
jgi:hypothetical protein